MQTLTTVSLQYDFHHSKQITVLDVERQEPVDLQAIPKDRWDLLCCLCRQRMGAKIQCAYRDCCTAYHPLCARLAGEAAGPVGGLSSSEGLRVDRGCRLCLLLLMACPTTWRVHGLPCPVPPWFTVSPGFVPLHRQAS